MNMIAQVALLIIVTVTLVPTLQYQPQDETQAALLAALSAQATAPRQQLRPTVAAIFQ